MTMAACHARHPLHWPCPIPSRRAHGVTPRPPARPAVPAVIAASMPHGTWPGAISRSLDDLRTGVQAAADQLGRPEAACTRRRAAARASRALQRIFINLQSRKGRPGYAVLTTR